MKILAWATNKIKALAIDNKDGYIYEVNIRPNTAVIEQAHRQSKDVAREVMLFAQKHDYRLNFPDPDEPVIVRRSSRTLKP